MNLIKRRELMMQQSPFDRYATLVLKRDFSAYWFSIRDFGNSNPSIVPYINIDPHLICSFVNVGVIRRLWSKNNAYINSTWRPSVDDTRLVVDAVPTLFGGSQVTYRTSGAYDGSRNPGLWINHTSAWLSVGANDRNLGVSLTVDVPLHIDLAVKNGSITGSINDSVVNTTYGGSQLTCQRTSWIFAANEGAGTGFNPYIGISRYTIYAGGVKVRDFVPYKSANDVFGFLDLVNFVFYENMSSTAGSQLYTTETPT